LANPEIKETVMTKTKYQSAFVLFSALACLATIGRAAPERVRFMYDPDIAGDHIVFIYGQDLWLVSHRGGTATRLTEDRTVKFTPRFAPNGKTIAYSANIQNNIDVFLLDTQTKSSQQITWHPSPDFMRAWSPDSRKVLFLSDRLSAFFNNGQPVQARLFELALQGNGLAQPLPMQKAFWGAYSPAGDKLAFTPTVDAFQTWRRYRGGQTPPVWLVDTRTFVHREIPRTVGSDTTPLWLSSGIYFRSDRDGVMRVYRFDEASNQVVKVAGAGTDDVDALGGDEQSLVYTQAGYLFHYDIATATTRQVEVRIETADLPNNTAREVNAASLVEDVHLSPDGSGLFFEARGDLFALAADGGTAINLTTTPRQVERDPVVSRDGKQLAYLSDASGEYQLHVRDTTITRGAGRMLNATLQDYPEQIQWSPDGQWLSYINRRWQLCWLSVRGGEPPRCAANYTSPANRYVWSADSQGIYYLETLVSEFRSLRQVKLHDASVRVLSDGLADIKSLSLSADGQELFFLASTEAGPAVAPYDFSTALYRDNVSWSAFRLPLQHTSFSPVAITGLQGRLQDLQAGSRDELFVTRLTDPLLLHELRDPQPKNQLQRFAMPTATLTALATTTDTFSISQDRSQLLLNHAGVLSLSRWQQGAFSTPRSLSFDSVMLQADPRFERQHVFNEAWTLCRDYFHDTQLHGADWKKIRSHYEPWLAGVRHRNDLDFILRKMIGELGNSHFRVAGVSANKSGFEPAGTPSTAVASSRSDAPANGPGLLGADFVINQDRYQISRILSGNPWGNDRQSSPLAVPSLNVKAGDYILEVNGQSLQAADSLESRLQGTAGVAINLRVGPQPSVENSRVISVMPLASEQELRRRTWIDDKLQAVQKLSQGKIAYLHQPDTSGGGLTEFIRYFFPQVDRDALIIDERFNDGGADTDYQLDVLSRQQVHWYAPRDLRPSLSPQSMLRGPKVMLINAEAGSGGDVYPYQFKLRALGTVIGTRTWGGVNGGYRGAAPARFIDGGSLGLPDLGTYAPDGAFIMENEGFKPDIEIDNTPLDDSQGRDAQLERAVEYLLEQLKLKPPAVVPEMQRRDLAR
jgi:tricorn protease